MSDYEFMESLGAQHPITVSVTVAEAEQRERRGLPLPISGDAESDHAKELLRIRQERKTKSAAEAAAPAEVTVSVTPEREWVRPLSPLTREQRSLLAEVRRRDGDACRVCRVVVNPKTRRSANRLCYRILNPGTTLTADGVVVVCSLHDATGEVMAPPAVPVYSAATQEWLDEKAAQAEAARTAPGAQLGAEAGTGEINYPKLHDGSAHSSDRVLVNVGGVSGRTKDEVDLAGDVHPVGKSHLVIISEGQPEPASLIERAPHDYHERSQVPLRIVVELMSSGFPAYGNFHVVVHVNAPHSVGAPNGAVCDNPNPTEGDAHTALAAVQRRLMVGGRLAVAP